MGFPNFPVEDITYHPKTFQGENWAKKEDNQQSGESIPADIPAQLTIDKVISLLKDHVKGSLKDNAIKYLEDYKAKKVENIKLKEEIDSLNNELAGYKFAEVGENENNEK